MFLRKLVSWTTLLGASFGLHAVGFAKLNRMGEVTQPKPAKLTFMEMTAPPKPAAPAPAPAAAAPPADKPATRAVRRVAAAAPRAAAAAATPGKATPSPSPAAET